MTVWITRRPDDEVATELKAVAVPDIRRREIHQRRVEFRTGGRGGQGRSRYRDRYRHRRVWAHPGRTAGYRRHQAHCRRDLHRRSDSCLRILWLRNDFRSSTGTREPRHGSDGGRSDGRPCVASRRPARGAAQSRRRSAQRATRARPRLARGVRRGGRCPGRGGSAHRDRRHGAVPGRGEAGTVPCRLAGLPAPIHLGKVEFDDGTWRTAFGCEASAAIAAGAV